MHLISDLPLYKDGGVLRTVPHVTERFGEKRMVLAAKNSTFLPHCPKKIKYLQSFLEISPKKISFSTMEGKIYLIIIKGYI